MIKRIPRADQAGVALPKMKRIKVSKSKKTKSPEEIIQTQVDALLNANHIAYLRLPDTLFRCVKTHPWIGQGVKINIFSAISGWPDNLLMHPLCEFNGVHMVLSCMIENKSDIGQLHGKQLAKSRELGYNTCRTLYEAEEIVSKFKRFHSMLKGFIGQYCKYPLDPTQAPVAPSSVPDKTSSGHPLPPQNETLGPGKEEDKA